MLSPALQLILAILLIGLLLLNFLLIQRAERYFQRLPTLPAPSAPAANADAAAADPAATAANTASVSIIVPARNEAANIGRCVNSLVTQQYPRFNLTVVDDESSDGTGEIAARAGATVLRLEGSPPAGWTGKCYACDQAARQGHSLDTDWLLFTDADTYHQPDALRRALCYAESQKLDALSLLLRQECGTFAERSVLPLAYQQLFAALHPDLATFNGQHILIRRQVYEASGGFAAAAVRGRVMEDVALAELLRQQGYRIALANGESAASVRMYRDLRSLWNGMTKTTFTAAKDRGLAGVALALLIFCNACLLPLLLIGWYAAALLVALLALLNILLIGWGLLAWLRRFGIPQPRLYGLLNPVGITFLWLVGLVATSRALFRRGVRWKDRTIRESDA